MREARMRQHLDIADVEASTKIRAKYLRALENEEFSMLPGPTFVKTFLRTYAEALGLDPHVLVEEYRAAHEAGEEPEVLTPLGPPGSTRERRRIGGPRRPVGPLLVIGLGVLAVIGALLVIGLLSADDDGGGSQQASSETETQPTRRQRTERERRPPPRPRRVRAISCTTPSFPVCTASRPGSGAGAIAVSVGAGVIALYLAARAIATSPDANRFSSARLAGFQPHISPWRAAPTSRSSRPSTGCTCARSPT